MKRYHITYRFQHAGEDALGSTVEDAPDRETAIEQFRERKPDVEVEKIKCLGPRSRRRTRGPLSASGRPWDHAPFFTS